MIRFVSLRDFRNYERRRVEFAEGINIIIGGNGRGKSNLLEALFLMLQGRSTKAAEGREMIREGQRIALVEGALDAGREVSLRIVIEEDGTIRGKRRIEGLGAVCFQPDDIWMVKGGPETRRKYVDDVITSMKATHRETLKEYTRVLKQRNEAIKAVRRGARGREYIRNWNNLLIEKGGRVVTERRDALSRITGEMYRTSHSWGLGRASLKYYATMGDEGEAREKSIKKMERMEEAEIRRGSSLIGPHRDELLFLLDGRSVRRQCSQGEQKLITIIWRLSQARLLEEECGEKIVLLMDDCLSELDAGNRRSVIEELGKWRQSVITTTDELPELAGLNKIWLESEANRE